MTSLSNLPVSFHISINVLDMNESVAFFSKVFGVPPAKHRDDYAKFELENPCITFSLEPIDPTERGVLNHVGFKFQSSAELVEVQKRLEAAGIRSEREEGVECCYSRQTKFWLHDPDGTLWEMYILEEDIEHRGAGQSAESVVGKEPVRSVLQNNSTDTPPKRWAHRLGSPLEIPNQHQDQSLEEIALQGTFNGAGTNGSIESFLRASADALKPGGKLFIHCLTADRHLDKIPELPGPASVVKSVPCLNGLVEALEAAGFHSIQLTTYRPRACFEAGDAEMRETKIEAVKPITEASETIPVLFRGPLPFITLETGEILERGRRTEIQRSDVEMLKSSPLGDLIVILEAATSPVACTG